MPSECRSAIKYKLGMSHAIEGLRRVYHDDARGLPLLLGFLPSGDSVHQGVLRGVVVAICKLRTWEEVASVQIAGKLRPYDFLKKTRDDWQ